MFAFWPAPGLDDTQLSESGLLLELHRAQITDRRVSAFRVVEATVNEAKKQVLIGTDGGMMLSYPISDEALEDYKENPDAYFGRLGHSSTKPLDNIYDLFEWFLKTHQHVTRDDLLQRLGQVPGTQSMTDEELRLLYCEGLASAVQRSTDLRNAQKAAESTSNGRSPIANTNGKSARPTIKRDPNWPNMWRVHLPNGQVTDMVNFTRAREAVRSLSASRK